MEEEVLKPSGITSQKKVSSRLVPEDLGFGLTPWLLGIMSGHVQ